MPVFATAGSKLFIGGVLDPVYGGALNASSFTGQTWVEVNPLESLGSFGDSATEIEVTSIGDGRDYRIKGTRNAGNMEVVAFLDYSDAGQLALLAAEATDFNYAFRVVFDDAPPGGDPSERLFVALVMTASEALDGANNAMKLNATLGINSNIVRILAGS